MNASGAGVEKVLKAISRYSMLASGDRVAIAVSGGRDSVCLFHVLRDLAPRLGFTIAGIAHLNHQLRGDESDADEEFVAGLALRHGVRFFCERAAVASQNGNLEQAARRARHAFFDRLVRENGADCIATGHTSSDQAETVLFRLLRGSGLRGLAGILPVTREKLIRPLLLVSREETETYLRERGIPWRDDSSNADPRFARNRIRHGLLPRLAREWNPEVASALANLADLAQEEERWWDAEVVRLAGGLLLPSAGGIEVEATKLAALPRAAARRLMRAALGSRRLIAFSQIEQILDLATLPSGRGRLDLPGALVLRSFDWLRIAAGPPPRPSAIAIPVPGRYPWMGGTICVAIGESPCGNDGCVRLKSRAGGISAPLELRGWRVGDRYRRVGQYRDQKIKELFQETRVPSWRRVSWPIITSGSNIIWAREFGAAESAEDRNVEGPDLILRIWEEKPAGSEPEQGYSASVSLGGRTHDF